jgi:hypothetical protein
MNNGNTFNFVQTLSQAVGQANMFRAMLTEQGYQMLYAILKASSSLLDPLKTTVIFKADRDIPGFQFILSDLENDVKLSLIFGRVPKWQVAGTDNPKPIIGQLVELTRQAGADVTARRMALMRTLIAFGNHLPHLETTRLQMNEPLQDGLPGEFYFFNLTPGEAYEVYAEFALINNRTQAPQEVE